VPIFEGLIWYSEPHLGNDSGLVAQAKGLVAFTPEYVYIWGNTIYEGHYSDEMVIVISRECFVHFQGSPHQEYLIPNDWEEIDSYNRSKNESLDETRDRLGGEDSAAGDGDETFEISDHSLRGGA
jgi:hypothetical protein